MVTRAGADVWEEVAWLVAVLAGAAAAEEDALGARTCSLRDVAAVPPLLGSSHAERSSVARQRRRCGLKDDNRPMTRTRSG